jgi:hypothetical protein
MRTLLLIEPKSSNDETNLQSDHDGKMTGSSLVGTVLARSYKILELIDVDNFKAHDLTLDQTVTVKQALLKSQRDGDTWRQKVQQLALVRDPNLLNVLDVIFDKSSDCVITELPRGHSLGATHMLSTIFERFITMKKLLILLISFTFICTVKATNCDMEIGFICRTSVGGKLMSLLAKGIVSNFSRRIGMNTRVSILE